MPNRLERESSRTSWSAVPPIGPDGLQPYIERAHELRGGTVHDAARRASRFLAALVRRIVAFVRRATHGPAKLPSQGSYRGATRLTADCR